MKRLFLLVWIGCAVTAGAAEAVLDNSGNYIPLLDMPKEKLGAGLQKAVEKIKASKISTPEAAKVAALRSTDDKLEYMRDARTILRVKSLLRIGRDVPELGENSDFVWFVHADMLGTDLEIFCVNASNGKVMRLFPEKTTPNKVSEPNEKVVMEMDSANPSNVLITITFRNPVPTSEKGVVINYHSVFLQRDSAGTKTNAFLTLSPGPTQGVSVCTFSIPENEVKTCTVHLAGVTSKPLGEGEVAREVKLGSPNQISHRTVDPQRANGRRE